MRSNDRMVGELEPEMPKSGNTLTKTIQDRCCTLTTSKKKKKKKKKRIH